MPLRGSRAGARRQPGSRDRAATIDDPRAPASRGCPAFGTWRCARAGVLRPSSDSSRARARTRAPPRGETHGASVHEAEPVVGLQTRNGKAAATDRGGLSAPTSISLDDSVAVAVLIPEREHGRHALAEAQHLGVGVDATSPKLRVRGVRVVGREADLVRLRVDECNRRLGARRRHLDPALALAELAVDPRLEAERLREEPERTVLILVMCVSVVLIPPVPPSARRPALARTPSSARLPRRRGAERARYRRRSWRRPWP
jgi:hypothetical protein